MKFTAKDRINEEFPWLILKLKSGHFKINKTVRDFGKVHLIGKKLSKRTFYLRFPDTGVLLSMIFIKIFLSLVSNFHPFIHCLVNMLCLKLAFITQFVIVCKPEEKELKRMYLVRNVFCLCWRLHVCMFNGVFFYFKR